MAKTESYSLNKHSTFNRIVNIPGNYGMCNHDSKASQGTIDSWVISSRTWATDSPQILMRNMNYFELILKETM